MTLRTPIDDAYRRCRILAQMLEEYRSLARSQSNNRRWINLGVVPEGEKPTNASKIIDRTLDELAGLISHVTILDMAAALERAAQARIGNAVGSVRKARDHAAKSTGLPSYSANLIMDQSHFSTLKTLAELLDGFIDKDLEEGFKASKAARNTYAHGTNVITPPIIDSDRARDYLNKIYNVL